MQGELNGKRIAILVANGFEQVELTGPQHALADAGAEVLIVSPEQPTVKGWLSTNWGDEFHVDVPLDQATADDFDGLVLPGGVMNPDKLRHDERALDFVRSIFDAGKTIGAICHGPWTLIDAGIATGKTLTSYQSIRTDLTNAGAHWLDREVVVDQGLITSRTPADIPAFNCALIAQFAHAGSARTA